MTCSDCSSGWRAVTEQSVLTAHPLPMPTGDAATEAVERYEHRVAEVHLRRAAARNTVYPCKVCQPSLFYRWAGGHLDPDHDASSCAECVDSKARPNRRTTRHDPSPSRRGPVDPGRDPSEPSHDDRDAPTTEPLGDF